MPAAQNLSSMNAEVTTAHLTEQYSMPRVKTVYPARAVPEVVSMPFAGKHILMIIENLPAPFDRRVWQEANTLKEHGAKISIICPKMKGFNKSYECLDGIEIYRHPLPLEGSGLMGYLMEYSAAIFWEMVLAFKIYAKNKFHVIHGCNPPDLIFITALPYKLFGVKYVFDHHDINPELFIAKFNKKNFLYKMMVLFERITFQVANYTIATNESYKSIAMERGKKKADSIQIVRSGPNLKKLIPSQGFAKYRKGKSFLVGYVGVIGEQEGLDLLLQSIKLVVAVRNDVQFAIVGDGTNLSAIKQEAANMGIQDHIDFYGRVNDQTMLDVLNSCHVCVNPDRPNVMNDLSTMNKIMEYMALKKAIVQYDLKEGRFSAQKASLYAKRGDTWDFAQKIMLLLDNKAMRDEMGEWGFQRVKNELSWEKEGNKLVKFYKKVLGL